MSQQKFASNVVEKCLTFGGPEERQLLVNEMLGSTDENEPLQVCETLFPLFKKSNRDSFNMQTVDIYTNILSELRSL